ncbi:MAG TPA: electron transporter, partial [Actinomycetes bacterium]|nr:electron transporter [Actinomycetes bacterium]
MGAGRRRTRMLLLGLAVAVVAAAGAVAWFQPQKLFIDQRVDEALPGQVAPSEGPSTSAGKDTAATPVPSGGPVAVATGRFRSLGHTTSGRVAVLEVDGGRRYLRLDDLVT